MAELANHRPESHPAPDEQGKTTRQIFSDHVVMAQADIKSLPGDGRSPAGDVIDANRTATTQAPVPAVDALQHLLSQPNLPKFPFVLNLPATDRESVLRDTPSLNAKALDYQDSDAANVNRLLQAGADKMKSTVGSDGAAIASVMAAFTAANGWDPANMISAGRKGAVQSLDTLTSAGVLTRQRLDDSQSLSTVPAGSLVFGTGLDGKDQAAIKGSDGKLSHVNENGQWVSDGANEIFQSGTALDVYAQSNSMSVLKTGQRQMISAMANNPDAYGYLNVSRGAGALSDQLNAGVAPGFVSKQEDVSYQLSTNPDGSVTSKLVSKDGSDAGAKGSIAISQDKNTVAYTGSDGMLRFWRNDIKTWGSPQYIDSKTLSDYQSKQFTLYTPNR